MTKALRKTESSMVVGGGGWNFDYLAGAAYFASKRVDIKSIFGSSAGALVALLIGLGLGKRLMDFATGTHRDQVIGKLINHWNAAGMVLLRKHAISNLKPLRKLILNTLDESDGFIMPTYVAVTDMDLRTEELILVNNLDPEAIADAFLASCVITGVWPLVYGKADGGFRSNVPIGLFLEERRRAGMQVDQLVYIVSKPVNYKPVRDESKPETTMFRDGKYTGLDAIKRGADIVLEEVVLNDIARIEQYNETMDELNTTVHTFKNGKTRHYIHPIGIWPSGPLGNMLDTNRSEEQKVLNYQRGLRDASIKFQTTKYKAA